MHDNSARALLDFYLEAGADALIGEEPVDRFASEQAAPATSSFTSPLVGEVGSRSDPGGGYTKRIEAKQSHPSQTLPHIARQTASVRSPMGGGNPERAAPAAPDEAIISAREAAKSAGTLDELRAILDKFDGCALKATASRLVFADGNPEARVMLVGEAPGRDEDIEGLPFVGRSGKLLDLMLAAIGLDRASVYIANIVPWRPPGNRTPTPQESAICLPFVLRQIELVDPDILVCLGGPSAQTLLNIKDGITKTRGRWFTFDTGKREIRAIATFHPAFLLRSPLQKRFAWRDFLAVKKALTTNP